MAVPDTSVNWTALAVIVTAAATIGAAVMRLIQWVFIEGGDTAKAKQVEMAAATAAGKLELLRQEITEHMRNDEGNFARIETMAANQAESQAKAEQRFVAALSEVGVQLRELRKETFNAISETRNSITDRIDTLFNKPNGR